MTHNDDRHGKISIHKGAMSGTHLLAVTNDYIIGLVPTQQEGKYTWYWRPSQLPRTSELTDLRKKTKEYF